MTSTHNDRERAMSSLPADSSGNLSAISILHPDDRIREDTAAKTVAFFCRRLPVKIGQSLVDELKVVSAQRGGSNVRVCLHEGPDSLHHDMVILENSGKYYRPHRHLKKGEAFHVIEGRLGLFAFDPDGTVIDAVVLEKSEVYRVAPNMFHAVMPMSDPVIYHENKPGPFEGIGDSVFPEWAPDGSDLDAVRTYTSGLRSILENLENTKSAE